MDFKDTLRGRNVIPPPDPREEERFADISICLRDAYVRLRSCITAIHGDVQVGGTTAYIPFRIRFRDDSNFAAVIPRRGKDYFSIRIRREGLAIPDHKFDRVEGLMVKNLAHPKGKLYHQIQVCVDTDLHALEKLVRRSYEAERAN